MSPGAHTSSKHDFHHSSTFVRSVLDKVGDVHGHLIDGGVVERLNLTQRAHIILGDC
jgi:hypothetical protein